MDARPDAQTTTTAPLSAQEMAVLQAFLDCQGRVISRLEIARRAGLVGLNSRRCDSILVSLRRVLGPESIRTVRSRGWMLEPVVVDEARRLLAA
jgi:DNA-binding response OmpR family regulator